MLVKQIEECLEKIKEIHNSIKSEKDKLALHAIIANESLKATGYLLSKNISLECRNYEGSILLAASTIRSLTKELINNNDNFIGSKLRDLMF